jgi:hypothetical protein
VVAQAISPAFGIACRLFSTLFKEADTSGADAALSEISAPSPPRGPETIARAAQESGPIASTVQ